MMITIFLISSIAVINAQNSAMDCSEDQFPVNDWDGGFSVIRTDSIFSGAKSEHNNHHEDRKWRFRYCKPLTEPVGPFTPPNSHTLPETDWDAEWYRGCGGYNGGHAVIHGIDSYHDNKREDRKFTFHCGMLDVTRHKLRDCYMPPSWEWANEYDEPLNFNCPNNGVIRSIRSIHDNGKEDRRFAFECCTMRDVSYNFSNIVGKWEHKFSCSGCSETEFTKQFGTESSVTNTIQSSYSTNLEISVSAGFTFIGDVSTEIKGGQSESISNEMSTSFKETYSETTTFKCLNTYLYQWIMSGDEERSDGTTGVFYSYSNDYLCTNSRDPKCPVGYCADDGCQTCTDPNDSFLRLSQF